VKEWWKGVTVFIFCVIPSEESSTSRGISRVPLGISPLPSVGRDDTNTKKLSHKEKEFLGVSFPEGLELAPSRNRGLPVGHGASALATLLISSIVDEV